MIYRRRFLCVYLFKVQGVEYGQHWWTREWKEFGIFIPTCCPQWKNPFINVAEICCCSSLAWLRDWYDFVGIFHSSSETPCCVKRPQFKHYNCFIVHSCIEHFSPRHQHRHCPIEASHTQEMLYSTRTQTKHDNSLNYSHSCTFLNLDLRMCTQDMTSSMNMMDCSLEEHDRKSSKFYVWES